MQETQSDIIFDFFLLVFDSLNTTYTWDIIQPTCSCTLNKTGSDVPFICRALGGSNIYGVTAAVAPSFAYITQTFVYTLYSFNCNVRGVYSRYVCMLL